MTRTVSVPVVLPEWVWGRLASIAENREVTIADLIADQVCELLAGASTRTAPPRVWAESGPDGRLKELMDEVAAARLAGWRAPRTNRKAAA